MHHIHVLTPGDHYSPRTGSAIATVVHGLCSHRVSELRPIVALAKGTYSDRYPSADIVEYEEAREMRLPPRISPGMVDAGLARVRLPRLMARRRLAAAVKHQADWPNSVVFGHNAPQLIRLVEPDRHAPFLYAHNDVLKTYRPREASRDLPKAVGIICVSEFLAGQISKNTPARMHDRIRVVHNGVDVQLFRRETPLHQSDHLRVVFLGRMIRDKGADVLVKAVAALNRTDIHLTIIGSRGFSAKDPLTDFEIEVRNLATDLDGRVSIRPFLPRAEVAALLSRSDVLVVPSRWAEPFALTVREGQAAGMAVVASNIGGIPEALGGHGVLVAPDDPHDLAQALEALAENEGVLRSIGERARSFAESHDWTASVNTLETAVGELLS